MGCKLSISVVHPSKSPKLKKRKSSDIPNSPIFSNKTDPPDQESSSEEDVTLTLSPDSDQSLDIYQYV